MQNREIIARLLAYHPDLGPGYDGCDGWKAGDPAAECTGIAAALVPTVDVIRRAAEQGCNLLIVHEPTNYSSPDEPGWPLDFDNTVFAEKQALLRETGMAIWRDHDHMHAHRPDSIFTGVIRGLGWEQYYRPDDTRLPMGYVFDLPETTVSALAAGLVRRLGLNGVRYVGNGGASVRRVAIAGHLFPGFGGADRRDEHGIWHEYGTEVIRAMEAGIDVIIPGEIIEWTVLSYARDAAALGRNKAVINIGHFNWEELGMQYAAEWLAALVGRQLPVRYLPTTDLYRYLVPEKED